MRYLEDLYKALGFNKPFKKDGTLSKQGEQAEAKLLEFLNCCHNIGLIKEFDEDEFDEEIYEIMNHY